MMIRFEDLRSIMKASGIPVFRDEAPTSANYPFIIYEFVDEVVKRASSRVIISFPLYQITLVSNDTEEAIKPLKQVLDDNQVVYSQFESSEYDENDSKITQYITYVRCIHHGE